MLSKNDVLGVMITYNPDLSVISNINSIIDQVSDVLIIDNGSDDNSLKYLYDIKNQTGVKIIFNRSNMGIAYALNQGLTEAKTKKFTLILTMDQDSNLYLDCIDRMINVLNKNSSLVSVGPNYNNKVFGFDKDYHEVDSLITSGNLTLTNKAISAGGYNSDLFIDSVDFDFSLALRKNQGMLAIVSDAKMDHKLGEIIVKKILGYKIRLSVHSPLRHYYMYRNHYYIKKKYFRSFTKFCIKKEVVMWKYLIEVLVLHPNKRENFYMITKGVKHAIQNKYGKYSTR